MCATCSLFIHIQAGEIFSYSGEGQPFVLFRPSTYVRQSASLSLSVQIHTQTHTLFFFNGAGIEPRDALMLGNYSTTELCTQPPSLNIKLILNILQEILRIMFDQQSGSPVAQSS